MTAKIIAPSRFDALSPAEVLRRGAASAQQQARTFAQLSPGGQLSAQRAARTTTTGVPISFVDFLLPSQIRSKLRAGWQSKGGTDWFRSAAETSNLSAFMDEIRGDIRKSSSAAAAGLKALLERAAADGKTESSFGIAPKAEYFRSWQAELSSVLGEVGALSGNLRSTGENTQIAVLEVAEAPLQVITSPSVAPVLTGTAAAALVILGLLVWIGTR